MFSSAFLFGKIADFVAPRPLPRHEFLSLLSSGQFHDALFRLRAQQNFWLDELDEKGHSALHVACAAGAMVSGK